MRTFSVATVISILWAAPVLAQPATCDCQAPLPPGTVFGEVSTLTGQVLVSENGALSPAAAGSPLYDGSRLVLGPASSAALGLGDCSMSVGQNSEVDIFGASGAMCVRVQSVPPTAAIPGETTGDPRVFAGFAAVGAGAVIYDEVNGGDQAMSR